MTGEKRDGVGEAAVAGMHDEIDGAAAAGLRDLVEEARPVDAGRESMQSTSSIPAISTLWTPP
ncbi:MAG: hypothetical protein OYG32_05515 [Rhodospirillaceae bacterium]|nr:hypothetical protein [Rhodospirillaceae bacterium]MDE0530485.1 hypothetical protein [Albidovulum sp.]